MTCHVHTTPYVVMSRCAFAHVLLLQVRQRGERRRRTTRNTGYFPLCRAVQAAAAVGCCQAHGLAQQQQQRCSLSGRQPLCEAIEPTRFVPINNTTYLPDWQLAESYLDIGTASRVNFDLTAAIILCSYLPTTFQMIMYL